MTKDEYILLARRLLNKDDLRKPIIHLSRIYQYDKYGPLTGPKEHYGNRSHSS